MKLNFNIVLNAMKKAEQHPKFQKKSEIVRSISGVNKTVSSDKISSEEGLIKIMDSGILPIVLLTPDELLENGTACGEVGNSCFTQEVVDYLKKSKVTEIFTVVEYDSLHSRKYILQGAVVNISQSKSEKLSRLVDKYHGSWRADVGDERGWSSFESE